MGASPLPPRPGQPLCCCLLPLLHRRMGAPGKCKSPRSQETKPCSHTTGSNTSPAPRGGLSTNPLPSSPNCVGIPVPAACRNISLEEGPWRAAWVPSVPCCPWKRVLGGSQSSCPVDLPPKLTRNHCPAAQRWGHEAGLSLELPRAPAHILRGLTLPAQRCPYTYKDTCSL